MAAFTNNFVDIRLPITKHYSKLAYCVACRRSGVALHEHHVIPQNAGGVNGPQVTLCVDHHELIHDRAKKERKKHSSAIVGTTKLTRPNRCDIILDYLVDTIIRAERLAASSPSKPITFSCSLKQSEVATIKRTMFRLGLKNYSEYLRYTLDKL